MAVLNAIGVAIAMNPATAEVLAYEPVTVIDIVTETSNFIRLEVQGNDGLTYFQEATFTQIDADTVRIHDINSFDAGNNLIASLTGIEADIDANSLSLSGSDVLPIAFGGNDTVDGSELSDDFRMFAGDDFALGRGGDDLIYGNQGNDLIYGNTGGDTIYGGQHVDVIYAGQHNDVAYGNLADDVVYGNLGDDVLYGGQDQDVLYGGQDQDTLYGNLGNDTLYGNLGDDALYGGAGVNHLIGGAGADIFYVDGDDVILDLAPEDTVIMI